MFTDCSPFAHSGVLLDKLKPGVFLTAAADGCRNTMIIGWGSVSVIWNKPMMVVFVRDTRATHPLLEKSGEFTISVPIRAGLEAAVKVCGTRSGRDIDKFAICGLTPIPGRVVLAPIIGECDLHYECRVLYRQRLDQAAVPQQIKDRFYSNPVNNANHTMYFAEIVACYADEGAF